MLADVLIAMSVLRGGRGGQGRGAGHAQTEGGRARVSYVARPGVSHLPSRPAAGVAARLLLLLPPLFS